MLMHVCALSHSRACHALSLVEDAETAPAGQAVMCAPGSLPLLKPKTSVAMVYATHAVMQCMQRVLMIVDVPLLLCRTGK